MDKKSLLMDMMIGYYKGDVRRINHFVKVHGFAIQIGKMEDLTPEKMEILEVAALVHDIGIKVSEEKYQSSAGNYQELEGPILAQEFLEIIGYHDDVVERVCHLVGNHHSYDKIDDDVFQILVEADFLVNIHEDHIEDVKSVKEKIFKTQTGINYLQTLFEHEA